MGNAHAKQALKSWANAEQPEIAEKITVSVFKATCENNTDNLSPAPYVFTCPDIPLHANAMLKMARGGIVPKKHGSVSPLKQIEDVKAKSPCSTHK